MESLDRAHVYSQYKIYAAKAEVLTVPLFLNSLYKQDESLAAKPSARSLGRRSMLPCMVAGTLRAAARI